MLALTPDKLYFFNLGFKGRDYKLKGEAAVWDRAGLRISNWAIIVGGTTFVIAYYATDGFGLTP